MVRSVKPSVSPRDWRVSLFLFFLSAGKGGVIPDTLEQAEKELKEMLGGMFGGASTCTTVCKMDKKQRESSWVPSVAFLGVRFLLRFSRQVRP